MNKASIQKNHHIYSQNKLLVRDFPCSERLKAEMRKIIDERKTDRWNLCKIENKRTYIALIFYRSN